MQHYQLVMYDLDGTLVNSGHDLVHAVQHTLIQLELPIREPNEILSYIGDGLRTLLERSLYPNNDWIDKALDIFKEFYSLHLLDNTSTYPRVQEILHHCKEQGLIQAVISNKRLEFTQKILEGLQLSQYFCCMYGGDSFEHKKPHPEPILAVLEQTGIPRASALMVGDNHTDILAGSEAGVHTCFIKNGLGTLGDSSPTHTIDQFSDVMHLLNPYPVFYR